ncbi:crtp2, partial [Symbiodinium pilosum]
MTVHGRLLATESLRKPLMDDRNSTGAPGPPSMEVDYQSSSVTSEGAKRSGSTSILQGCLLVSVVLFGCANNIAKQIAAQPLKRYTYMLGLSTAVAYVPLYWCILGGLLLLGVVPRSQLRFVWRPNHGLPALAFFAVSALGDSLGDTIGAICTPHVSGPLHSLLSNCTPIFIAILSMCILQERYSFAQSLALLGVFLAVVTGLLPSLEGLSVSTEPVFAVILGGSCIFNAVAFVLKELVFKRYKTWQAAGRHEADGGGLNIFVMNAHLALFQLPLTIMLIPLNELLKQTNGEGIGAYTREAMDCLFSGRADSCGEDSNHGELAGRCVAIYVVFNVLWNMAVLLSVKHSGALATFIALKAIFPVSAVLFAYVDWPLLGPTHLSWLVWLSIALLLPSIAAYQYTSQSQARRAMEDPSLASCCWPLCTSGR